uniref:Uncharacterized protein n=1 Tax=Tanacetum cinerariifolium TaxID=118510 RepID=A0A6L2J7N5_TANCI|nr:hypothetical protein [Tanacetum cinerariifolium]
MATDTNCRISYHTPFIDRIDLERESKVGWFSKDRNKKYAYDRMKTNTLSMCGEGIDSYKGKGFRHSVKEYRKPKRVKDYAYHKEKMMMCKQEEKGTSLNADQGDWLDDTDEESDKQESHDMYMAKTQEVLTIDSGPTYDVEPLEKDNQYTDDNKDERAVLARGFCIYRIWKRINTSYRAMWDMAYWGFLRIFNPSWFLVKCRDGYSISSLMDMAY